jgi:predicted nucleic acid-binding protein
MPDMTQDGTRYVIGADVAFRLAEQNAMVRDGIQLFAPTLIRSQLLSLHYQAVCRGELTEPDARARLDHVRGLRIRLLGDRMMQGVAWTVADQLGWSDTLDAEYIALTRLQADAFVTLDRDLAHAVRDLVTVAPFEALIMGRDGISEAPPDATNRLSRDRPPVH